MGIDDRNIKRKLEAWVGTLTYHSAVGEMDTEVFGEYLQSIITPLMPASTIREVTRDALAKMSSCDDTDLKGEILKRHTPERMTEHLSLAQEMLTWRSPSPAQEAEKTQTIGDLIQGWAESTGQNRQDFEARMYPKLEALVQEWQSKTGCLGLTNEVVFQHPKEAGEFMTGFIRLLIEETPQAKLIELLRSAMRTITETPSVDFAAELQGILRDSCGFTAWKTGRQMGATLEANPEVKAALSTTEVAALVAHEECKHGWANSDDKPLELLEAALAPELRERAKGRSVKAALQCALRSAGRRSLLNNLADAIKGQLRNRLIQTALRWLKEGGVQVVRHWEFPESPIGKENGNGVRDWLFRRR